MSDLATTIDSPEGIDQVVAARVQEELARIQRQAAADKIQGALEAEAKAIQQAISERYGPVRFMDLPPIDGTGITPPPLEVTVEDRGWCTMQCGTLESFTALAQGRIAAKHAGRHE